MKLNTYSALCSLVDEDGTQGESSYPYASEVIKVNAYSWIEAVTHIEKVLGTLDDLVKGRPIPARVWVITRMVRL